MKTRVTVETITDQLQEDRAFARSVEQAGPAMNATIAIAKLHGLLIDRKESGAPGDFSNLASAEDVIEMIRRELGNEAADALATSLNKRQDPPADGTVEPGPAIGLDLERDSDATLN